MVLFLSILYVLVCFLLVVAVLLQEGKGGGISAAFGGGGGAGQTLFGAGGAGNFLTKATSILGGAFMLFSLLLALLSGSGTGSRQQRSVLQPNASPTSGALPGTPGQLPAGQVPVPGTPGTVPPAGDASTPAPAETPAPAPGTSGGTGN